MRLFAKVDPQTATVNVPVDDAVAVAEIDLKA
jgi:hypothetical protein